MIGAIPSVGLGVGPLPSNHGNGGSDDLGSEDGALVSAGDIIPSVGLAVGTKLAAGGFSNPASGFWLFVAGLSSRNRIKPTIIPIIDPSKSGPHNKAKQ